VTDLGRDLPDPGYLATLIASSSGAALAARVAEAVGDLERRSAWSARWRAVDGAAATEIAGILGEGALTEPAAVRAVAASAPDAAAIYVSNSMPVRDADSVWPATATPRRFFSHRGAAGIDGLTAAATGATRGLSEPVVLLTGDLAFLHDLGGLMAAGREGAPLVVVVLDNGGGGIFSTLPVSEAIPADTFDRLYTTPHGMDLTALAAATGVGCRRPTSLDQLRQSVADACAERLPTVIHLAVDIAAGFAQREQLADAVGQAAAAALAE
jgi:2-succinyl-5-enolpyruvyl-6-hydroxy-3-cyclohexene-1-carboxylate synthase